MKPRANFVVVHNVKRVKIFSVVNQNNPPLQMNADFVSACFQFADSQSSMPVNVTECRCHFCKRIFKLAVNFRRKLFQALGKTRGGENGYHNLPVNFFRRPALRSAAISANAVSTAAVACFGVAPYSSSAGK